MLNAYAKSVVRAHNGPKVLNRTNVLDEMLFTKKVLIDQFIQMKNYIENEKLKYNY